MIGPSPRAAIGALALALGGCGKPSPTGVALDKHIREPSGVTASATHEGVFWVHGDSGTGNWLFAVDRGGRLLARLRVEGGQNVDWEDITRDDRGNLWLGDIGNNDSSRRDLVVYRIPEPDPDAGLDAVHVDLELAFRYPEQAKFGDKYADFDAESLFWWDEQLWLLTKHRSDDRTWLYRFPTLAPADGEAVELERVVDFDLGPSLTGPQQPWSGQVSGAEAKPDGRHWALLSYDAAFVFELPPAGAGAQLFAAPAARIGFDMDVVGQVEAITWDGDALVVINEDRHVFRIPAPLTTQRYPSEGPG